MADPKKRNKRKFAAATARSIQKSKRPERPAVRTTLDPDRRPISATQHAQLRREIQEPSPLGADDSAVRQIVRKRQTIEAAQQLSQGTGSSPQPQNQALSKEGEKLKVPTIKQRELALDVEEQKQGTSTAVLGFGSKAVEVPRAELTGERIGENVGVLISALAAPLSIGRKPFNSAVASSTTQGILDLVDQDIAQTQQDPAHLSQGLANIDRAIIAINKMERIDRKNSKFNLGHWINNGRDTQVDIEIKRRQLEIKREQLIQAAAAGQVLQANEQAGAL